MKKVTTQSVSQRIDTSLNYSSDGHISVEAQAMLINDKTKNEVRDGALKIIDLDEEQKTKLAEMITEYLGPIIEANFEIETEEGETEEGKTEAPKANDKKKK